MKNTILIMLAFALLVGSCKDETKQQTSETVEKEIIKEPRKAEDFVSSDKAIVKNNDKIDDCVIITNLESLYGKYILFKTTDIKGKAKTPVQTLSYVILNDNNTYKLVFGNGKTSAGEMKSYHEYGDELDSSGYIFSKKRWQFELVDFKNEDEPSYSFVLGVENDDSIYVLEIPQGVGDNSWLKTADVWFLRKEK